MRTQQEIDKIKKIYDDRESLVVKSNTLIQDVKFDLTETEMKLLIYTISKVAKEDTDFKHITLNITEYCDIVGINKRSGGTYKFIKDTIKSISDKSWWLLTEDNKERLFRWYDTCELTPETGRIDLVLSSSLKPYLLELKQNFTQFRLINVLCLHSKHSIRLYERFKMALYQHELLMTVEEFKEYLGITDKYQQFKRLKVDVIKKCIEDINNNTDLEVEVEYITRGRKVEKLYFKIRESVGAEEVFKVYKNQQMTLKDYQYWQYKCGRL